MSNLYAALEIGTTRTVMALGEGSAAGRLKITCHAEIPSAGIRKSQIQSIPDATQSIRSVLASIEKKQDEIGTKITVGNAFLAISGQHVKADPFTGTVQIADSRVEDDDLNNVQQASRQLTLPKDRELLDVIEQDYEVDNRGGIPDPRMINGRILKLNTLQIHADHNRIEDARTAADAAHLEIREPLYAVTCAADAVLEDHEKKNGVLVIDLGGGSTGFAAYTDGYAISTGVIGVGGDHISSDIAHAFQTTHTQAERLKQLEARALVGVDPSASIRVKIEQGENTLMDNRTISRRALDTVVNARMLELFTMLRETLEDQDLLHRLHAGVVLTGGGAALKDVDALAERVLGMNVRIGRPINVDGLEGEENSSAFATIAGALLYAHHNYEERSFIGDMFGRFFK